MLFLRLIFLPFIQLDDKISINHSSLFFKPVCRIRSDPVFLFHLDLVFLGHPDPVFLDHPDPVFLGHPDPVFLGHPDPDLGKNRIRILKKTSVILIFSLYKIV